MRIVALLLALVSVGGLTACKTQLESCRKDDEIYTGAREMPPLRAPPDLQAPDTRNSLKIPPLDTPERRRGKDEPCLDAPPPFDTKKAASPPAEPQKPE